MLVVLVSVIIQGVGDIIDVGEIESLPAPILIVEEPKGSFSNNNTNSVN